MQVGQGAAGLLIIEDPDPDEYLPGFMQDMEEVEMLLQNLDLHKRLRDAAIQSEFYISWREGDGLNTTNVTTDITDLMLVNMQFVPKVVMKRGQWQRWRLGLSSYFDSVAMRMEEEADCEFMLIAKDGIYLQDAPRAVPGIILSPGNRADVAVRCKETGLKKVVSFDPFREPPASAGISMKKDEPPFAPRFSRFNPQPEILLLDVVDSEVLSVSEEDADEDLEHLDIQRPCYLVDLTNVDSSEIQNNFTIRYACADPPVCNNVSINNMKWKDKNTYLKSLSVGKVQETGE